MEKTKDSEKTFDLAKFLAPIAYCLTLAVLLIVFSFFARDMYRDSKIVTVAERATCSAVISGQPPSDPPEMPDWADKVILIYSWIAFCACIWVLLYFTARISEAIFYF